MAVGRWLWVGIGIGAVALAILPISSWVGAPDAGPLWAPHVGAWSIGILVVGLGGLMVGRTAAHYPNAFTWTVPRPRHTVLILAVLTTVAALTSLFAVFAGNPHLVDEVAQLFNARVFASGRAAAPVPALPEFFLLTHTFVGDGGWVSQYPPGHAALLALGFLAKAEWLVNPVLGGLGVPLVFAVGRGLYGPKTGLVAAVLWALSPWVWFMSSSYMNHVSGVTLVLAGWAAILGPVQPRRRWGIAAGVAFAAAAATRPLDALAGSLPIVFWLVARRRWSTVAWMVVGGAPVVIAVAVFNWQMFGDPLTMGYTVHYGAEQRLGFHVDPWGRMFTPWVAVSNLAVAVRRLHIYLYEWPIPSLLPLIVWALARRRIHPSDGLVAMGILGIPVLYFFYWHSGFYLGPRFYYACLPFIVLGTARAWRWMMAGARRRGTRHIDRPRAVAGAAVITVVWGFVGVLPSRVEVYRDGLPSFKLHPERELRARGVDQALLLVPVGWGTRIIVSLWDRGVSPALVERAYRRLDTCDLFQFARQADADQLSSAAVATRLETMMARTAEAPALVESLPDPTIRLRPRERLPAECARQIRHDLTGIAVYGNHGWRNAPTLDRGIVFARDLFDRTDALLAHYPGWEVWRWAPAGDRPNGRPSLVRIGRAPPLEGR